MSDASGAEEAEDNRIRLKPKPIEIGKNDGFEKHDLFGYKKFGEKLASLFVNAPDLDVAVLDDQWGSGKTIFAKQWAGHMRNDGHLVVEIDAFANDYQDDPFNLLVLEILAAGDGVSISEEFKDVTSKLGRSILLNMTKVLTAGAVKGEDIEAALKSKYDGAKEEKNEVVDFKEQLSLIAKDKKLIIVVDELDRCRPDFAIRFIERIKHFFDVPNVSFLLITSKAHLASMVGVLYGFDADHSDKYLSKFIDVSVALPENIRLGRDGLQSYINYLVKKGMPGDHGTDDYWVNEIMYHFASGREFSLRDIEEVYSIYCLTSLIHPFDADYRVSVLAFAFLKVWLPNLYSRATRGENIWPELSDELGMEFDANTILNFENTDDGRVAMVLAVLLSEQSELLAIIGSETFEISGTYGAGPFASSCADGEILTRGILRSRGQYVNFIFDEIDYGDFSI